jgi:serine protease Do
MDDEKNIIEGEKVEERKPVTEFKVQAQQTKQKKSSFGKTVAVPFVSGVLGATLVIGTCFGVPNIKKALIGSSANSSNLSTTNTTTSSSYTGVNTDLVSLKEYNETGVYVAAKVLPSVVGISVEFPVSSIFGRGTTTTTAEGSGIIITEDGYILTNNHIVSSSSSSSYYTVGEASKVTVYLYNDETGYDATIIGTDEQTDLAVIKIDQTGLTAAELGDSDSVQVGEFSMAIGNPLGLQSSVSTGTVSAVNRKVTTDGVTYTLIQTDAAINSGNSGGALVNSKGQVIGINTLKLSGTGIEGMGFAIPINSTKSIYQQLIDYQKVKRPYIGISGRDLTEELAKANNLVVGIYVTSVEEFSAAEKAGIKIGDVITGIQGTAVTTMDELNDIKNQYSIGDTVTITINRNGSEKELSVTLQEE